MCFRTICTIILYVRNSDIKLLGDVLEKIVAEHLRNTYQQLGIYRCPVEYIVDITPAAIQPAGKPHYRVRFGLAVKYLLNETANMYHC